MRLTMDNGFLSDPGERWGTLFRLHRAPDILSGRRVKVSPCEVRIPEGSIIPRCQP